MARTEAGRDHLADAVRALAVVAHDGALLGDLEARDAGPGEAEGGGHDKADPVVEAAAALRVLAFRDRLIVELRVGMAGTRPHSLSEIGALFGVTKQRVRQLEARAIREMREALAPAGADNNGKVVTV
jgi:RNA polymerase primary sigma factor